MLPAYCWVLGLGWWRRALLLLLEINGTINYFLILRMHARQDVKQQANVTQLLISLWMNGTRGGAVSGGVGGFILISSSSSSVTLLSMKSTCSATPFTAKSQQESLRFSLYVKTNLLFQRDLHFLQNTVKCASLHETHKAGVSFLTFVSFHRRSILLPLFLLL